MLYVEAVLQCPVPKTSALSTTPNHHTVIKVFENIHIVIPFLYDLQWMLLCLEVHGKNLLSLLIKIKWVKNHGDGHEQIHILSFPYVVCALPLHCISLLCLIYHQRCLMGNGGKSMC